MTRLKNTFSTLALVLGLFAFRSSFADQYVIPSGSMKPTIEIGDHVWVDKAAYDLKIPFTDIALARLHEPRRGDVVVFRDPRDPKVTLIKRLVGLPGDHLRVTDGWVEVNGAPVAHHPIHATDASSEVSVEVEDLGARPHLVQRIAHVTGPAAVDLVIPSDRYFFMGDNRDNSADSRYWGFAPRDALRGKARNILYTVRWSGWLPEPSFARSGTAL